MSHLFAYLTNVAFLRLGPFRTVVDEMLQPSSAQVILALFPSSGLGLTSGASHILHLYPGGGLPASPSTQ